MIQGKSSGEVIGAVRLGLWAQQLTVGILLMGTFGWSGACGGSWLQQKWGMDVVLRWLIAGVEAFAAGLWWFLMFRVKEMGSGFGLTEEGWCVLDSGNGGWKY